MRANPIDAMATRFMADRSPLAGHGVSTSSCCNGGPAKGKVDRYFFGLVQSLKAVTATPCGGEQVTAPGCCVPGGPWTLKNRVNSKSVVRSAS